MKLDVDSFHELISVVTLDQYYIENGIARH